MLEIRENIPLKPKTTLKIGGNARWYAELKTKKDCEEAAAFSQKKQCPLIVLGGGSNTIFADGTIEALVVRIKSDDVRACHAERSAGSDASSSPPRSLYRALSKCSGSAQHDTAGTETKHFQVYVEAGKNLANLINELAEENLDLSPLTGIPGSVGGAVFGNAGQGFGGVWIGNFIEEVEAFVDNAWKTFTKDNLAFGYRTSAFKTMNTPLIWSVILNVPRGEKKAIQEEVEMLLQKRIETQPHVKTAGSCFLSISEEEPAWKLIDAAGLRGKKIGDITISEKHANFLINEGEATFEDTKKLIQETHEAVGALHATPLQVEMRLVEESGDTAY